MASDMDEGKLAAIEAAGYLRGYQAAKSAAWRFRESGLPPSRWFEFLERDTRRQWRRARKLLHLLWRHRRMVVHTVVASSMAVVVATLPIQRFVSLLCWLPAILTARKSPIGAFKFASLTSHV
jgi:hypothetical protein